MCMLLGWAGRVSLRPSYEFMLSIDRRGRDAFGAFTLKTGKITTFSRYELLDKVANIEDKAALFVGRAVPATEYHGHKYISSEDIQPFIKGDWIVTHNGLLHNDTILGKKYRLRRPTKVDSFVIAALLDRFTASGMSAPDAVVKVLDEIEGSYALAIYNPKQNYLALVTNFMPLYYKLTNDTIYWSSLPVEDITTPLEPYSGLHVFLNEPSGIKISPFILKTTLDFNKVGVVCSGGMDSVTALRLYQVLGFDVTLIHFKYGQAAQAAEDYVTTQIANTYGIRKITLNVQDLFKHFKSVLLRAKQIPDKAARLLDAEGTYSYVPARNLIFAAIGLGVCEELGLGRLVISGNLDDGGGYPDNNYPFFKYLDYVSALSLNQRHKVRFEAPFVHLTKKEILEIAFATGTPLHMTASCYYPELRENGEIVYCGSCGCDKLRVESFKALGYIDPVKYKTPQRWGRRKSLWKHPQWADRVNNINLRMLEDEIPFFEYLDIKG